MICTNAEGSCTNFIGSPTRDSCEMLTSEKMNSLVVASKKNEKAIEIWSKEEVQTGLPLFQITINIEPLTLI